VGSDTGGSVRIPAALCGVCGFKPSQGLMSTNGVFPLSPSLDHLGLLTKTMGDMALVFRTLTGVRPSAGRRLSLGVTAGYFTDDMDEDVSRDFATALAKIAESTGTTVKEVKPKEDYRRYSRARATITCKEAAWFYEELLRSQSSRRLMHQDVLALMDRGLRTGMIEYMHSMNLRARSVNSLGVLLTDLDALVMPTCPIVAPKVDDIMGKETGRVRALLLRNTELFNICGFPALSIPMNATGRSLPTSIQIVGRFGEDGRVAAVGERIWRALHPRRDNR